MTKFAMMLMLSVFCVNAAEPTCGSTKTETASEEEVIKEEAAENTEAK